MTSISRNDAITYHLKIKDTKMFRLHEAMMQCWLNFLFLVHLVYHDGSRQKLQNYV